MIYDRVEFLSTVAGGFPVLVRAAIVEPNRKNGEWGYGVEDLQVLTRRGKPAPWLKISEADTYRLIEEALDAAF